MIASISTLTVAGLMVLVVIVLAGLSTLKAAVNIVQQGQVGVLKRLGQYRKTHEPGLVVMFRSSTPSPMSTCARFPSPATVRT